MARNTKFHQSLAKDFIRGTIVIRKRLLRKLMSGGSNRKSRLHTEQDVFIGYRSVVEQTPIVTLQKISNSIMQKRPAIPWWPLPAIKAVDREIHSNMVAIEFGSGSSTLWIAKRVKTLIAREHDKDWASLMSDRVRDEGIQNCCVQYRQGTRYFEMNEEKYDFAVVDGHFRWKCIEALMNRMNSGGLIYFDNSDSDKDAKQYAHFHTEGSFLAQKQIAELERTGKVTVNELHGMINGELFAGSGMLIRFM